MKTTTLIHEMISHEYHPYHLYNDFFLNSMIYCHNTAVEGKFQNDCLNPDVLLCKNWVQDSILSLPCYDYGNWHKDYYEIWGAEYEMENYIVLKHEIEVTTEFQSIYKIYNCEGVLLESCRFGFDTN